MNSQGNYERREWHERGLRAEQPGQLRMAQMTRMGTSVATTKGANGAQREPTRARGNGLKMEMVLGFGACIPLTLLIEIFQNSFCRGLFKSGQRRFKSGL
jgi:hypothetical protein